MLLSLQISDFALVDQLEIDLGAGINVLTGETGAGKSIILDAIDVALGGRVNHRLIRSGSKKAMVEATFQVDVALKEWLQEQEIDLLDEESVICSREIAVGKGSLRSRSRVNGVLVNRAFMEQLRPRLVEITAQGQTMQLMVPAIQRQLLDYYGGEPLLKQRQKVSKAYKVYQEAQQALIKRRQSEQERLQRLDWLEYQTQELREANLDDPEELTKLEIERDRLSHAVELQNLSYQTYQLLYQNDSDGDAAADLLGKGEAILTEMAEYDPTLEPLLESVKGALMEIVAAGQQINTYGDSLETDPEQLDILEERVSLLKQICRKYGPNLSEAIIYYRKLQTELEELTDDSQALEVLEQEYAQCQEKLTKTCQKLTKLRQKAAVQLEARLIAELKPLAMEKVQFECRITPSEPSVSGGDRIIFHFSPNPGEKLQPLSSTASGGEMSRFLLALKACFADSEENVATLVFDEIDTGVSGRVAQAIAEKLHQLSQSHQILCVTHQPLIAAMADIHFRVDKEVIDRLSLGQRKTKDNQIIKGESTSETAEIRTVVRVTSLKDSLRRQEELAQLAGGQSAQEAMAFAESLLSQAAAHRQGQISS